MPVKTGLAATATTLFLLCTTSAFAVDATAFAGRLKAVVGERNATLDFTSAEAQGENVVIKGAKLSQGPNDQTLGDLTFENVSGSTADGWTVEKIAIPDITQSKDKTQTTLSGMMVEGLELVGTSKAGLPAAKSFSDLYFDKATIGSVSIKQDGKEVFDLTDASIDNTIGDDGKLTSEFGVDTFKADLQPSGEAKGAQALKDMGYATIDGAMSGTANWDPKSGLLQLDPFDVTVDDAGNLSFTYAISGYTPDFITSLQQVQQQMSANPDNSQATGMAMMGLISQLYLNSADVTFIDDSLTGKLLDYYAKQNGQTREQLSENLVGMLPAVLSYVQNPEFQKKATDAVTAYLADPQSLSITVAPENPVPATQLIGAAMGAPQTLPGVLSLNVTANDAESSDEGSDSDVAPSDVPSSETPPADAGSGTAGSAN